MKLLSYLDENERWVPVEVELELWPGLPEIHFLGRADQHLRESAKRIKSAIRAQGFEFPVGQQILVNLKPSYLKKSSRGLELAVAAAYLMESGQIPREPKDCSGAYYGELSLSGEVSAPEGLAKAELPHHRGLLTGQSDEEIPFDFLEVRTLQDLVAPKPRKASKFRTLWRPDEDVLDLQIPESFARLLGIVALGGHSLFLAGAAGSGKTTAAKILHALLPEPTEEEAALLLRRTPGRFPEVAWRPFVAPHHKTPVHSLMGGGNEAYGGDLARADLGFLLLDEFLEFSPPVIEALRQPLEQKKLRIPRGRKLVEYDLRAQFMATTNLCPCGDYVPGEIMKQKCRFTLGRCQSYSQRISGPLLDRFEILKFLRSAPPLEKRISVRDLRGRLQELRVKLKKQGREPGTEDLALIKKRANPFFLQQEWENFSGSERRRNALLRVAQSACDWQGDSQIGALHFKEAIEITVTSFEKLKRWDFG